MRAHDDLIVVANGCLVAATRVHDRNKATVILLHLAIRKSEVPQQFDPPDLEPDEMVRMIDDPHLVSFGIAHAQPHLAPAIAHLPLQRGFRFSRNEVTPSRKSAVWRIWAFSCTACSICISS